MTLKINFVEYQMQQPPFGEMGTSQRAILRVITVSVV